MRMRSSLQHCSINIHHWGGRTAPAWKWDLVLPPWLSYFLSLSPYGDSHPDSVLGCCMEEAQALAMLSPTSPHLSSPMSRARKCQRACRKVTTASNIQAPGSQLSHDFHFPGLISASLLRAVLISMLNVIGKCKRHESKLEFVWINCVN